MALPRLRRAVLRGAVAIAVVGAAAAGVVALTIAVLPSPLQRLPREWAEFIDRQSNSSSPRLMAVGSWVANTLRRIDRGSDWQGPRDIGRPEDASVTPLRGVEPTRADWVVGDTPSLVRAIEQAQAGERIGILPGRYRLTTPLATRRSGRADAPIRLYALGTVGAVVLEVDTVTGLVIAHAHWDLQGLEWRGVCEQDDRCEHALHIKRGARGVQVHHNRFIDFNAAIKINGEAGEWPDEGLLRSNDLRNTRPRSGQRPVVGIDLVGASGWTIEGNTVSDIVSDDPRRASYGIYAKGGAVGTRIEANWVVCEQRLRGYRGARIGISLGGGGTTHPYCRSGMACEHREHHKGWVVNNRVLSCSDVGISLWQAHHSRILHNTLGDTAGILVRGGDANELSANLVDGPLRALEASGLHSLQPNQLRSWWQHFVPTVTEPWRSLRADRSRQTEPPDILQGPVIPEVALDRCGHPRSALTPVGDGPVSSRCPSGRLQNGTAPQ